MSGLAFLYVVETGWGENIALLATISAEEGELSAVPGDTPTSFLTDSRAMANDSLDCHNHRAGSPHDEDQRICTPAIRRKRAEGFPAGNWVMLCPALATVKLQLLAGARR